MTNEAKLKLNEDTVEPLVRLLLRWYYGYHRAIRWYYGYHRAIEAHKADCGDVAIKPHFLAVYLDTENVLGPMRDAGTLSDKTCHEIFEQVNR